jgi:sialate O-acetylesterase
LPHQILWVDDSKRLVTAHALTINACRFMGLAVLCLASGAAHTQVTFDRIFSDHMVLQRDRPLLLSGRAAPGQTVQVSFGPYAASVLTGADSVWRVVLPKQHASSASRDVKAFTRHDTATLRDVLVGDVWVCLGQSNMEWPMAREAHFAEELPQARQPLIRLYNPAYAGKNVYGTPFSDSIVRRLHSGSFLEGGWERADSNSIRTMSAVGWYFARSLVASEGVPVGLVNLSVGGAPLEAMMALDALGSDARFSGKLQGDWLSNESLPVWVRERGRQNVGGVRGVPVDALGPAHPFKPGFLYESSIRPLQALPVRGLLCYQGESNAQEPGRVQEYPALFARMVEGLRWDWDDPSLPMYFVQLSSIDTLRYKGRYWPEFRDGQRRILDIVPHSGMAVSSDHGLKHDVHPTEKRVVGERLARWALHDSYGRRVTPSGPLPIAAAYRGGRVVVRFRHARGGLGTADGTPLRGFSLDGAMPARATVSGRRVRVVAPVRPAYIYFGWKPFSDANLVNREGLPASSFKLEVK